MKIQNTNLYNIKQQNFALKFKNSKEQNQSAEEKRSFPFINPFQNLITHTKDEDNFCEFFLGMEGKISLEDYQKITSKHPRTLAKSYKICQNYNKHPITNPHKTAKIALALKDYYDKKYENYTIVSIGASPAPFTQVMENLGSSVIYLPISDLRFYKENALRPDRHIYPTIESKFSNIAILMKYASQKGITKKSKGELVVLDYVSSGRTLGYMTKILEQRGDIPANRIHAHSIIEDLANICNQQNPFRITNYEIKSLKEDLKFRRMEDLANVPHFGYDDTSKHDSETRICTYRKTPREIFREFEAYSTMAGRAWALCSTHEAMKILGEAQQ